MNRKNDGQAGQSKSGNHDSHQSHSSQQTQRPVIPPRGDYQTLLTRARLNYRNQRPNQ